MNRGMFWLVVVFVSLLVVDVISTLIIGFDLIEYLELNPLYSYVGVPGIIALNIFILFYVRYKYKITNNIMLRWGLINALVIVCLSRIHAIIGNIMVYMHPPTIEQAMSITQQFKTQALVNRGIATALIPYLVVYFGYLFFRKDHNITKKEAK